MPEDVHKTSGVRAIFANLRSLLLGKAGAGLLSLAYLVITAHSLGARDYGTLIVVHGYATLIGGLVAFSGFHGVVRFGKDALTGADHPRFLRLLRFMTLVELGCAVLAILIAMLLAPIVGPYFEWSAETTRFAIFYSFAILATVRSTPNGLLQIADRFDLLGYHQLAAPLVRIVGAAAIWLAGGGLHAFLAVWLVAALAEGISMWVLGWLELRKMRLEAPLWGEVRGVHRDNEGLLPFIVTTNADITLTEFAPRAAPLIVGWILGPVEAGLLSLAQRASVVIQQPSAMLGQASFSVVADYAASGRLAALKASVWRGFLVLAAASAPIVLLLALFSDEVLALLGGSSFTGGASLLLLIAASRAVSAGTPLITSAIIALGRPTLTIAVNLARSFGLLPLLPLFIWAWGLDGAGWHMMLQSLASTLALALILSRLKMPAPAEGKVS